MNNKIIISSQVLVKFLDKLRLDSWTNEEVLVVCENNKLILPDINIGVFASIDHRGIFRGEIEISHLRRLRNVARVLPEQPLVLILNHWISIEHAEV